MKDIFKLIFGLLIVVIIIGIGAKYFESFVTEETIQVNIAKIERINNHPDEDYFLVHTNDEIFENRNHYFHNKQDVKEINKLLRVGKAYEVSVVGYNFGIDLPFFSKYRNIIEVKKEIPVKKIRRLH